MKAVEQPAEVHENDILRAAKCIAKAAGGTVELGREMGARAAKYQVTVAVPDLERIGPMEATAKHAGYKLRTASQEPIYLVACRETHGVVCFVLACDLPAEQNAVGDLAKY